MGQGKQFGAYEIIEKISKGEMAVDDLILDPIHCVMLARTHRMLQAAEAAWHKRVSQMDPPARSSRWYVGPSGCGKSFKVNELARICAGEENQPPCGGGVHRPISSELQKGWGFCGYDWKYHHDVIFDEMDGSLKFKDGLRLMDQYPYTVPHRGKSPKPWMAKRLWFTSTRRPEEIWQHQAQTGESMTQWYRRCKLFVWDENKKEFIEDQDPMSNLVVTQPGLAPGFQP